MGKAEDKEEEVRSLVALFLAFSQADNQVVGDILDKSIKLCRLVDIAYRNNFIPGTNQSNPYLAAILIFKMAATEKK